MLAVPIPVQMNLRYVRNGPKPRQKDGPVVVNYQKYALKITKIRSRKITCCEKNLPGTVFFAEWLQASSSTQTSSISVPVAKEMPGGPAAVAFGDIETRSVPTASKATAVIARSQLKFRSIRKHISNYRHD